MTMALWGRSRGAVSVPASARPVGPAGMRPDLAWTSRLTRSSGSAAITIPALLCFNWTRFGLNAVDARERVLDAIDQIKKTAPRSIRDVPQSLSPASPRPDRKHCVMTIALPFRSGFPQPVNASAN